VHQVTTKLYPHQKQALSFLLDRERGSDPSTIEAASGVQVLAPADELNGLWQSRRNFANRVIGWSNAVVTDFQIDGANPPPQSRGAILADDMGLGKSICHTFK
jgi:SWI/SNF-related matrix-associated actin-dependent regulator of chromatin subfamily A3